jgi:hypothetical protein
MEFQLEHFSVNWIDGMKISKDHFVDSNNHVVDLFRDGLSTYVNSYNYGLTTPDFNAVSSFELSVDDSSENTFSVKLNKCKAITSGGFKINIDQTKHPEESLSKQIQKKTRSISSNEETSLYEIILIANPYKRKPIGTPSIEESPPRHPYTEVKYDLQIMPKDEINILHLGPYYFLLGKIKNNNGHISLMNEYIPASICIKSHKDLILFHEQCVRHIQTIQDISYKIIQKIHSKNKPSNLAKNFMTLCENTLTYISSIYFTLVNELPDSAPIKLINCMSTLANNHSRTYQVLPNEEREELLKYFFEWTEFTPQKFEQLLTSSSNIKYDHNNIQPALLKITQYLEITETVWNKMNSLDFIGQRKENIVVTKQTIQPKEEAAKKRWSILD